MKTVLHSDVSDDVRKKTEVVSGVANSVTVCMLGLTGTGKTSLIEALLCEYSPMNPPISTYGIIEREVEINKKNYIFLDVPGMLFDSDEWQIAISKSDAVIIMFDPTTLSLMYNHVQTQFAEFAPMVLKRKIPALALINKVTEKSDEIEQKVQVLMDQFKDNKVSYLFHMTRKDIIAEVAWLESFFV